MSRVNKVRLVGIAFISATILALLSVYVERVGPELAEYGDSDFRPILKGGFPVAYLFDMPGVSVVGKLSSGEDILRVGILVFDIAVYFAMVLLITAVLSRRWSARKKLQTGLGCNYFSPKAPSGAS